MKAQVVGTMVTYVFCHWMGMSFANPGNPSMASTLFIVMAIMGIHKLLVLNGWRTRQTIGKLMEMLFYWLAMEVLQVTVWTLVSKYLQDVFSYICTLMLRLRGNETAWKWLIEVIPPRVTCMLLVSLELYTFTKWFKIDDIQELFGNVDDRLSENALSLVARQEARVLRRLHRRTFR